MELWDEVVRLAKASGESATPTGGSWLYSRAECLGALRRWTDAERAYGEAADVLETALESTSGKKKDNATALTLALAHDGQSLTLGQLDDWPGAVEASRRALAAGGAAGVAEVVAEAVSHEKLFVFGELLQLEGVQALEADAEHGGVFRLLKLFAFGTFADAAGADVPALTPEQTAKLRLLSIVTLAQDVKLIPYASLLAQLQITEIRELEDENRALKLQGNRPSMGGSDEVLFLQQQCRFLENTILDMEKERAKLLIRTTSAEEQLKETQAQLADLLAK